MGSRDRVKHTRHTITQAPRKTRRDQKLAFVFNNPRPCFSFHGLSLSLSSQACLGSWSCLLFDLEQNSSQSKLIISKAKVCYILKASLFWGVQNPLQFSSERACITAFRFVTLSHEGFFTSEEEEVVAF